MMTEEQKTIALDCIRAHVAKLHSMIDDTYDNLLTKRTSRGWAEHYRQWPESKARDEYYLQARIEEYSEHIRNLRQAEIDIKGLKLSPH